MQASTDAGGSAAVHSEGPWKEAAAWDSDGPGLRYVDGLLALRPDPSRLVFATVAGVPPEVVASLGNPCAHDADCGAGSLCLDHRCAHDFATMLADPSLVQLPDAHFGNIRS